MYHKMDEEKLKEIEELTMTDYEKVGEFIPVDSIDAIIDDLLVEIHNRDGKIENMERDIENNYELKNINLYEEYGISESDFY